MPKTAKNFECRTGYSSVLPKAARTAAGIETPDIFDVMGSDGLERTDLADEAIYLTTLNSDEDGWRTQVHNHGDTSQSPGNRSAADVIETWRS